MALWDPAGSSLAAIYLVVVATPWTFVLSWITAGLGIDSYGFNIAFLGMGVVVNTLLLFGLGRLVQHRTG